MAEPALCVPIMVNQNAKRMMRPFLITASSLWLILASSASAQTVSDAQMRAANLARMQAEVINGGVKTYSTADCMHQAGGGSCLISHTAQGYRFKFYGGPIGWAARRQPPTLETVILVSPDGKTSKVEYNGSVRTGVKPHANR